MLVGRPSSKKSPTLREMSRGLDRLQEEAEKEYKRNLVEYKEFEKEAKAEGVPFDEQEPRLRRYLTDDFTIPKLRELFSYNPGGMILRSDELKGQLQKLDKEGNEGDRSFILQCWSGLEHYNEDRIGRGSTLRIPLTWIGCIPPTGLSYYLHQAMSEGVYSDGLMQRF